MKKEKFRIVRTQSGDYLRYKIKERTWIFWSAVGYAEYVSVPVALAALLRIIQERSAAEAVVCRFDEDGEEL